MAITLSSLTVTAGKAAGNLIKSADWNTNFTTQIETKFNSNMTALAGVLDTVTDTNIPDIQTDITNIQTDITTLQNDLDAAELLITAAQDDIDGFPNGLKTLGAQTVTDLNDIADQVITTSQWGYLADLNQNLKTDKNVNFNRVTAAEDFYGRYFRGSGAYLTDVGESSATGISTTFTVDQSGGIAIAKVVSIKGWDATNSRVTGELADNTNTAKDQILGVCSVAGADTEEAIAIKQGKLEGIDTSSFSLGDILYASTSGNLTATRPTSGRVIIMGRVTRSHASAGVIEVFIIENLFDQLLSTTNSPTFADLTVTGTLTVETLVEAETINVDDKIITLGVTGAPTDVLADGGGIVLQGDTDKSILWVDATDAWTSSEHFNIATNKEYRIAGTKVLDATLGTRLAAALTGTGELTGTLQTAAQTNVTSLGSITGLTATVESVTAAINKVLGGASGSTGSIAAAASGTVATVAAGGASPCLWEYYISDPERLTGYGHGVIVSETDTAYRLKVIASDNLTVSIGATTGVISVQNDLGAGNANFAWQIRRLK